MQNCARFCQSHAVATAQPAPTASIAVTAESWPRYQTTSNTPNWHAEMTQSQANVAATESFAKQNFLANSWASANGTTAVSAQIIIERPGSQTNSTATAASPRSAATVKHKTRW